MNLYDIAIRRPVFTVMMMVALVIFGVLGYQTLPINLLPSIDVPIVTVITILPGASPEVVESDITDVIEQEVNTIEGIRVLTSISGQGYSQITITFSLERDIDIAAQDVRDKVSGAMGYLPLDAEPPIVQKLDINSQPMLWMAFSGLDNRALSDYADQVVRPRLQSVPGVGNVFLAGFSEPMMRIWIDRDRLAAHRLSVTDVIAALGRGSALAPKPSFLVRTLLIQEYRKVLLRDPLLPAELLPAGWNGAAAYQLCRNLYRAVYQAADDYLSEIMETAEGPLPPPFAGFYDRFGGLGG